MQTVEGPENIILEKKHYYMQLLTNAESLKRMAEFEVLSDNTDSVLHGQLEEITSAWNYVFIGLLREGLVYDYLKNPENPEKDIIRLTIDNIQFDCPVTTIKSILKDEYDTIIKPGHEIIMQNIDAVMPNLKVQQNADTHTKSENELKLEAELKALKEHSAEETERLIYEINHDAMTGLKNKKAFMEDCKKTVNGFVISADINSLKKTNDTYGHAAGDTLIISTAKTLQKHFKHCVYRTGGDEFFLIIPDKTEEEICSSINDIKKDLKDLTDKSATIDYSLSLGYCSISAAKNITEALAKADEFMYEDKKNYKTRQNHPANNDTLENSNQDTESENIGCVLEKNDLSDTSTEPNNVSLSIFYNDKDEKIKAIGTYIYDIYDFTIIPPGGVKGEPMKAIIAPLYVYDNDNHPDIMVMLIDQYGNTEEYFSQNGLASVKATFKDYEFLIRGTFSDGNFKSFLVVSGTTMSMGYSLNKNIYEKRAKVKENVHYGHISFLEDGLRYHIVPLTLNNDENGIAQSIILVENEDKSYREILKTASNGFTVYSNANTGISYQILIYWQDDLLCAEVLKV